MISSRPGHDSFFQILWLKYFVLQALPFAGTYVLILIDRPIKSEVEYFQMLTVFYLFFTFPWPDLSNSIRPFSVPIKRFTPHSAAHRISELKRFLYFRISGVSLAASCDVGVTFTFTWLSRLDGPDPPAPKPNVKKLRCFCCRAYACGGNSGEDDALWLVLLLLIIILWVCEQIDWFGELWRDGEFEAVECGDEFDTNDFTGVEWVELIAARYWNLKKKTKHSMN